MDTLKKELEGIKLISEKTDTGHTIYSIKFIHSKHVIHKDVYDLLLKMAITIFDDSLKELGENLIKELGFEKCSDGKFRRDTIHDSMNVEIDEYGNLCINAEQDKIEIPITMIMFEDRDKFKDWLLFTYK